MVARLWRQSTAAGRHNLDYVEALPLPFRLARKHDGPESVNPGWREREMARPWVRRLGRIAVAVLVIAAELALLLAVFLWWETPTTVEFVVSAMIVGVLYYKRILLAAAIAAIIAPQVASGSNLVAVVAAAAASGGAAVDSKFRTRRPAPIPRIISARRWARRLAAPRC